MFTARTLLIRGMLTGAAAGVAAYLFATLFGEGPIDDAIAFEEANALGHEHAGGELVSRAVQSTVGLGVAALFYGVALGGLFALAFAFTYGRIGRFGPRATAALVALAGFVAVALVPFLKYPPNPPATGNADTLQQRTILYFLMIVIGVAAAIGAVIAGRALAPRLGTWNATIAAVLGYAVVIGLIQAVLPTIEEVPAGFPALTLWNFRLASLGTQVVTWATLGLVFGALTERSLRPRAQAQDDVRAGV